MSLFKECDLRGVYGEELTEEITLDIGRAIGTLLPRKACVVAGDVRVSTPSLKAALIEGLCSTGCRVYDIGIVPTPVYYLARHYLGVHGGVMVTASHNPPHFNGLKPILGPLPVTPEEIQKIERLLESKDFIAGHGEVVRIELVEEYVRYLHNLLPPLSSPKTVVVDAGNGSEAELAPRLFREFGYRVEELFCQVDGRFPGRDPNPALPQNLQALCRRLTEVKADFGVAFDGDGDRAAFVDERGQYITSDKAIVLFVRELLKTERGAVVYDLKCSQVVPEAIAAMGGTPLMERSGHTFLKTRMILERAIFGGEVSGHYFYRTLDGGDDGLYSALLLGRFLEYRQEGLGSWADTVPAYCITPDLRIPAADPGADDLIARIQRDLAFRFPSHTLDGIRIQFPEGWGLLRPSVTEPAITLRFEARRREDLALIIERFLAPVPELKDQVFSLPDVRRTLEGSDE